MKTLLRPISTQVISRHRSFIYGAAALMILFFHFVTDISNRGFLKVLRIFQDLSCCGVEMFLLLSGFGLVRSLQREPSLKRFWIKRFFRVLPPLLICALAFDILLYAGPYASSVNKGFVLDYIISSAVWYVSFIALMYFIFPFVERIRRKNRFVLWGMIILFVLLSFIMEAAADFQRESEIMRMFSRLPVFLLGCALAPWELENRRISRLSLPVLVMVSLVMIAAWRKSLFPDAYYSLRMLCFTVCAMAIIILLALLADMLEKSRLYRFFCFCGAYSLEIYLVFVRVRGLLYHLPIRGRHVSIMLDLTATVLTILISALIGRVCRKLSRICFSKSAQ